MADDAVNSASDDLDWKPLSADERNKLDAEIAAYYPVVDDVEILPDPNELAFWRSHERLWWVYRVALAKEVPPFGLLCVCLAITSSAIPPEYTTGDLGKGVMSLDILIVLYGKTGLDKSSLWDIVWEVLRVPTKIRKTATFEPAGLRDMCAFYDEKTQSTVRTAYNVIVHMDEGEALGKLSNRSDSRHLSILRSLAHGKSSELGTVNAKSGAGFIEIENYSLRFVALINLQPVHAHQIFNSKNVNDGTVQRFLFADMRKTYNLGGKKRAECPEAIDVVHGNLVPPGMDSAGVYQPVNQPNYAVAAAANGARPVKPRRAAVPQEYLDFMANHSRSRRQGKIPDKDAHKATMVMKLAHLVAIFLDNRLDPTVDDLNTALRIYKFSAETIEAMEKDIAFEEAKEENRTGRRLAHRKEAEKAETVAIVDIKMKKTLDFIIGRFQTPDAKLSLSDLTPGTVALRPYRDKALNYALQTGLVIEVANDSSKRSRTFMLGSS
jgi:hypothetical protein